MGGVGGETNESRQWFAEVEVKHRHYFKIIYLHYYLRTHAGITAGVQVKFHWQVIVMIVSDKFPKTP